MTMDWKLFDEVKGVQPQVKTAGLCNLIDYSYCYIDKVVVVAFLELWHPETNTFHLPFGEITITLEDGYTYPRGWGGKDCSLW